MEKREEILKIENLKKELWKNGGLKGDQYDRLPE